MSPPASANSRSEYVAGTPWRDARWTNWTSRLVKKGSGLTKSASGRSRTKESNPASISRLVLALRTRICSPMARAAGVTSLKGLRSCRIGRVDKHSNASGRGHQLTQKLQPLCRQFPGEEIDTGQAASRPGEAGTGQ